MYTGPYSEVDGEEALSIREIVSILWSRKWLVVAIGVLGLCVGVAATLLTTPLYRAKATLVPVQSSSGGALSALLGSFGNLPSMMGMGGMIDDSTTEALALFESRQFIQQFIKDEGLMPKLFAEEWDDGRNSWKVPPEKIPTLWKAYKRFGSLFDAAKDRKSGLVTVQFDWPDRQEAARLLNELITRVNLDLRERAMKEATLTIEYLQEEVKLAGTLELQRAINGMLENQIKLKAIASARQQFAFKVLDPAMVLDPDDRIRPRPFLYIVGGGLLGGMLGVTAVFVLGSSPRRGSAQRNQGEGQGKSRG